MFSLGAEMVSFSFLISARLFRLVNSVFLWRLVFLPTGWQFAWLSPVSFFSFFSYLANKISNLFINAEMISKLKSEPVPFSNLVRLFLVQSSFLELPPPYGLVVCLILWWCHHQNWHQLVLHHQDHFKNARFIKENLKLLNLTHLYLFSI